MTGEELIETLNKNKNKKMKKNAALEYLVKKAFFSRPYDTVGAVAAKTEEGIVPIGVQKRRPFIFGRRAHNELVRNYDNMGRIPTAGVHNQGQPLSRKELKNLIKTIDEEKGVKAKPWKGPKRG